MVCRENLEMAQAEFSEQAKNSSVILVDVAGTTTALAFIKDSLFPYVIANAKTYLDEHWDGEDVKKVISLLREESSTLPKDGEKDAQVVSFVDYIKSETEGSKSSEGLKQIQGLIAQIGYASGDLKGHVFDDVASAMKSWSQAGKRRVCVYSTGSVESQKLLFGKSASGDLTTYITQHFDQSIGEKTDSSSYVKIASQLDCATENIVFLTDSVKEATAASKAGVNSVLVVREGNSPISDEDRKIFPVVNSFEELPLHDISETACKRKCPIDETTEETRPSKIAKTEIDEPATDDKVKEEEAKEKNDPPITEVTDDSKKPATTESKIDQTSSCKESVSSSKPDEKNESEKKNDSQEKIDSVEKMDSEDIPVGPVSSVEKTETNELNTSNVEAMEVDDAATITSSDSVTDDSTKSTAAGTLPETKETTKEEPGTENEKGVTSSETVTKPSTEKDVPNTDETITSTIKNKETEGNEKTDEQNETVATVEKDKETNEITKSETNQVIKSETNEITKAETSEITKAETKGEPPVTQKDEKINEEITSTNNVEELKVTCSTSESKSIESSEAKSECQIPPKSSDSVTDSQTVISDKVTEVVDKNDAQPDDNSVTQSSENNELADKKNATSSVLESDSVVGEDKPNSSETEPPKKGEDKIEPETTANGITTTEKASDLTSSADTETKVQQNEVEVQSEAKNNVNGESKTTEATKNESETSSSTTTLQTADKKTDQDCPKSNGANGVANEGNADSSNVENDSKKDSDDIKTKTVVEVTHSEASPEVIANGDTCKAN